MKLYIDTNIYLSYISPVSDFKSLEKLKKLIEQNKVELVLPSQAKNETLRHFKERVKSAKDKLKKINTKFTIPNELKDVKKENRTEQQKEIIKKIDSLNSDLEKYRSNKINELKKHIETVEELLKSIFNSATFFDYNDEIVLRSVLRYAKDLPPKKNDHKFGDAIIWETLKENIRREDLVIISTDPDFCRQNNRKQPGANKILVSEWKKHTKKKLSLFTILGKFINTIDKEDQISQETIKKEVTQSQILVNSKLLQSNDSKMPFSSLENYPNMYRINTTNITDVDNLMLNPQELNNNIYRLNNTVDSDFWSNKIGGFQDTENIQSWMNYNGKSESMRCSKCGNVFEYYNDNAVKVLYTYVGNSDVYCTHCGARNKPL